MALSASAWPLHISAHREHPTVTDTATYTTDTTDLLIPHGTFRTAFGTAPDAIARVRAGDAEQVAAVSTYLDNVLRFLDAHHEGEDAVVWPRLEERCPSQRDVIARLQGQHAEVHAVRTAAGIALQEWSDEPDAANTTSLIAAVQALDSTLRAHLAEEEHEIIPLASRHLSPEEWGQLPGHAMQHFSGDKLWLVLGLVMEQMSDAQRATILQHLPPPVLDMWTTSGSASFAELIRRVRGTAMYGTVARYRIKPGCEAKLLELSRELEQQRPAGLVTGFIYRLESGGDEYVTAAVYSDRESYRRNSEDPAQQAWFARMSELLAGEPQWNDGEIIAGQVR